MVDGVKLSNFVTPAWYSGRSGNKDFLGKLTNPLTLTAGGYAQYLDPSKGWVQVTHQETSPRSYRRRDTGRSGSRRISPPISKYAIVNA